MSEIELKRCPLCGGEVHTIELYSRYAIECLKVHCFVGTFPDNIGEAITAWNTRPLEEELERTIAALVDAVQFALQSADFSANMNAREAEARLRALIGETL